MNIFVDLDGTLLNISEKYYRLYYDLCTRYNLKLFQRNRYWGLRRNGKSFIDVITQNNNIIETNLILNEYLTQIEDMNYLQYDSLFPGVLSFLYSIQDTCNLVLLTNRKIEKTLYNQLDVLNIKKYFNDILLQNDIHKDLNKSEIIKKNYLKSVQNSIIIGDSEEDILSAKKLNISSYAVLSGIRNRRILESLEPTAILKSVVELTNYINI